MSEGLPEAPQIEPFERAKRLFLEQLPEDQRLAFVQQESDDQRQLSTGVPVETLFYRADVLHKEYEHSSAFHACRKALRPLFNILEDYSKALDVASNIGVVSTVLAPLWGGLRVVLQIAQQDDKAFKELVEMLRQIGLTLPQFRDYHRLFPNHPRLMLALSEALANILIFCQKVKCCFSSSDPPKRWSFGRVFHKKHGKLRSSLPNYLDDFKQTRELIDKEATMAHMIEDQKQRQQQLVRVRRKKVEDVLSKISTFRYWTRYEQLQEERCHGTAEWLFTEPSFQAWITSPSHFFACLGIPGSGKSILASALVDQMGSEYSKSTDYLGYYFCDYSDPASLQFSAFVVSLVRQALQLSPYPKDLLEYIVGGGSNEYISLAGLSDAFMDFLKARQNVFLIIDGMDELPSNQQDKIFNFIKDICWPQTMIKIFISCRPGVPLSALDSDQAVSLTLQPQHVRNDILHYLEETIDAKVQSGRLRFDDLSLKKEIIDALSSGAKEMFLWVKFQIEEICECLTSLEIREALQDLPKDLATLYARILSRLQKSHGATAYAAFRWIVCAHRPLDTQELFEAIAIEESDDHFHWDRVISDSNKFLRACGNLVAIQLDGTVRLAHETVKQFLLQNHPRDAGQDSERDYSEEVRRLKFSFEEADNWIGRQCIAYLLFSEFESQVIAIKRPRLEIPTATFMPLIGGSLDELPKGKISLVLPGRGRKKQIDKHQAQFKILSYLQEFWILHLRHITEDSLGPYRHDFKKRVLQVAFTREYLFPIRPWEQPSYLNSFAYNHACEVIKNDARATHIPLFIWTLEHEVYYLHEILQSAEIQFREMMIFLLQYDKRRHKTLLRYAAEFGPTQVRVIMKYLEKINQTLDVGISVHMNDLVGALQWPSESTQMSLLASLRKAPSAQTDSEGTCFPIAHMWDSVPFPKKDYNWRQYCYDHFQHVVYGLFEKSFHDLFNSDVPLEITTLRPKVTVLRFLLQQLPDIDLSPEWLVKGCLSRILDDRIQIRFFQALVFHLENILSPELKNYLGKAALDWVFTFQAAWHCSPVPGKIKDELWIKLSDFYDHLQWEEDELPQKSRAMETFQMLLKDGATASSIEESIKATWPYPVRPDLQKRLDEFLGELDTILFAC